MEPIGYIYRIKSLTDGRSYIGQTQKTVNKRMKQHKNLKRNKTSSYSIILENNYIVTTLCIVPEFEYLLYNEGRSVFQYLLEIEQMFIRELPNVINKNKAFLTDEERAFYNEKYRIKNIEQCRGYDRNGYDCLCGGKLKKNSPHNHTSTDMHRQFINDENNYLDMRNHLNNLKFGTRENVKINMSLPQNCVELKNVFVPENQQFKNELFKAYMQRKFRA